jgi:putative tryptophan/tyrosine transport system substrate-binding protein
MRRRDFITTIAGSAVAWPLAARAQQDDRIRHISVLMSRTADDPDAQANIAAFHQGLQETGWVVGRNVRIDVHWNSGDVARLRQDAADLVAQKPDVILAGSGPTVPALQQVTHTTPVVFTQAVDPVGANFVNSLARPGGNITGFTQFDYGLSAKWFEFLRELVPQVVRVGVVRDQRSDIPATIAQWAVIQTFALPTGVEVVPINLTVATEIERAVSAFTPGPNNGLIVVAGTFAIIGRNLIVALAARHRLPTVYFNRMFVEAGGLVSYAPNLMDNYRRAAGYVDRILKGEKPADLPVQAPTKYELVINLKSAKALGLAVPHAMLTRADEVIE